MPQASEALRSRYANLIGEDVGDGEDWLKSRGYKIKGGWIKPPPGHVESEKDTVAINYLIEEWDYACL